MQWSGDSIARHTSVSLVLLLSTIGRADGKRDFDAGLVLEFEIARQGPWLERVPGVGGAATSFGPTCVARRHRQHHRVDVGRRCHNLGTRGFDAL
jgi:hypothetical protein